RTWRTCRKGRTTGDPAELEVTGRRAHDEVAVGAVDLPVEACAAAHARAVVHAGHGAAAKSPADADLVGRGDGNRFARFAHTRDRPAHRERRPAGLEV